MKRIGVVIPAITDDLQSKLLDGIFRTASHAGCDVIVLTTATNGLEFHIQNDTMEGEESIYYLLESGGLDGVLLASQYFIKETVRRRISEEIKKAGIPCIDLGGTELGFETVTIPQDTAIYEITQHVITVHGCRRLIFLAGHNGNPDSEKRLNGFLRSVRENGCEYDIVYGDFWKLRAAELGEEMISGRREKPDAVVCASDIMAITLCNTLQNGGISVPDDIIITGFDGHIFALSNYPSITTVSGFFFEMGCVGAARLIGLIGGDADLPENCGMGLLLGSSCGCLERISDHQAAALLVQERIMRDSETEGMLEMRINADIITKTVYVDSLEELMDMVDQTAHIINGYKKLELCILSDWNADPEHPDVCPEKPFPEEMMCVLSKKAWQHGVRTGVFRTAELFPMLAEEHDPMLVYVLPLHASSQVFGYCGMAYDNASGFTVSVTLFNYFSAIANGLRMLRHKQHAVYLQKKIEEASLYDKMTDMLSRKGLLSFLEKQEQTAVKNGIMLVTIARLSAVLMNSNSDLVFDDVMQSELLLANAIRLLSGRDLQAARLDKRTFAVVYPLGENDPPERYAEEMMIQLEVLIHKMQEGSAAAFLPEPYYVCGYVTYPAEDCLAGLWDTLSGGAPKANGFTGLSQLRRIRREIHKAPELNWNLGVIANRLNVSKSYVQKLFKEHFGISYMDDLINARIDMAKKLLTGTDLRIGEVSVSCGYQNATHFMRQFKEKTGVSPSDFRKKQL